MGSTLARARIIAFAASSALVLVSCGGSSRVGSPPTQATCPTAAECVALARTAVGKQALIPTTRTLVFQSGTAVLRRPVSSSTTVELLHFLDSRTRRSFVVNVLLGSDINCAYESARRQIRSPGGRTVCFLAGAGDSVDIRYTENGLEYIFSFFDPRTTAPNDPKSPVGAWALSVVDSYR